MRTTRRPVLVGCHKVKMPAFLPAKRPLLYALVLQCWSSYECCSQLGVHLLPVLPFYLTILSLKRAFVKSSGEQRSTNFECSSSPHSWRALVNAFLLAGVATTVPAVAELPEFFFHFFPAV